MSTGDYIAIEDRMQRLEKLAKELPNMVRTELVKIRTLDLVILKCHLLLEYVLNQFIDLTAHTEGALDDTRLTFKQKQAVAHMLGLPPDSLLLPSLDILNIVRNQVAHTLTLDRNLIDELIRINSEDPDAAQTLTDPKRVSAVKQITRFYCGEMLGMIDGMHAVEFFEEAQQSERPKTLPVMSCRVPPGS